VPVAPEIISLIKRLCSKRNIDDYLIDSTAQNQYGERSTALGKRFGRLKKAAKFDDRYVFHSIRKKVLTFIERAECPENVAASNLGHDYETMTFGLYSGGSSIHQKYSWIEKALVSPDEEFMEGK
jgi:hypothetical protein